MSKDDIIEQPDGVENVDSPEASLVDPTHVSDEDEVRKGTIARIADILRGKRSAVEPDDVEDNDEDVPADEVTEPEGDEDTPADVVDDSDTDEYEEIDPRFVDAARRYGWSDDRIVSYAEGHDDRDLVALTRMMEDGAVDNEPADAEPEPDTDVSRVLDEIEASEDIGDPVKQMLKSLVSDLQNTKAQLNSITTAQKDAKRNDEQQEWIGRAREADTQFDAAAKEFTELGSFDTLKRLPDGSLNTTDPAVQTRERLFGIAVALFKGGEDWNSAVRGALQWYKGGRSDDAVEDRVLQKIKSNAKRLSPRREPRHQTRKFKNDEEEKAFVINSALAKHGVELP